MNKKGGRIFLVIFIAIFILFNSASAAGLVNINIANLEELDTLPGIGPAKAQAIIDYRNNNGFFVAIEDIMKVSGIGQTTFDNMKDSITVGDVIPQEETPATSTAPSSESSSSSVVKDSFSLGDVVINEFVSDPTDGEEEWIELYNKTGKIINLSGWIIEEGSGAKTSLFGELDKFFVILSPKGNLNNTGDIIILRDDNGVLIDQVSYGKWDDGSKSDNAPMANDPASTARKIDGQNTYNNADDFVVSFAPTKEINNIIQDDSSTTEISYNDNIVISEIFPNPLGDDSETEFIELYNKGNSDIDLTGWKIGDESQNRFAFKSGEDNIIKSGEYLPLYRSRTNIALNNNGDSVKLFLPNILEPFLSAKYDEAVENWSYNLNSGEWVWSEIVTPGQVNEIKIINHVPSVDFSFPEEIVVGLPINFSSDDTFDADGDMLEYFWDFGDGVENNLKNPQHTFLHSGNFLIKLTVKDKESEASKEKTIRVVSVFGDMSAKHGEGIIINEFLPNPDGSDAEGEWIELYNQGNSEVNLLSWQIDDSEGGSSPYLIKNDLWIDAGGFLTIGRPESGLALNNTNDSVRLFDNSGKLADEVKYDVAAEGESYAKGENGKWFWTTTLTPKAKNIISLVDSQAFVLGEKNSGGGTVINNISLEEAADLDSGESVHVFGTVAVLPGILGTQYFYIVDDSAGLQIYNYKKDFPSLNIGDYIEVFGQIAVSNGEKRIKTKIKDDIIVIDHRDQPVATKIGADKVDESYVGNLVELSGEITDRKGSTVYFDDGTAEAVLYIKKTTGINSSELEEGESFTVTGIVSRMPSGIRVMPRGRNDISRNASEQEEGQVLGEVMVDNEWALSSRNKKLEFFKYLLVIAVGVIVVLGVLLTKASIRSKK